MVQWSTVSVELPMTVMMPRSCGVVCVESTDILLRTTQFTNCTSVITFVPSAFG